MMLTVTMPSRSMLYQMIGSNALPAGVAAATISVRTKLKAIPAPAMPARNPRRDTERSSPKAGCWSLAICGLLPKFSRSLLDSFANTNIGHAAAQITGHHGVYVLVAGRREVRQQRRRL